jgi:hypothetical protein
MKLTTLINSKFLSKALVLFTGAFFMCSVLSATADLKHLNETIDDYRKSDDGGDSWQPAFRSTFQLL